MVTFQLRPVPPYDFDKMKRRLARVGQQPYRFEGEWLVRTVRVGGNVYLTSVRSEGTVSQPLLTVRVAGVSDNKELPALSRHLARMYSVDLDMGGLYEKLAEDAVLAPLAERFYGLRIVCDADLFECMTKTIVGQQLNLSFAATLNRRLMEVASETFRHGDGEYPVFPSPEQVASLDVETLKRLQFSERKAQYVIDFARHVVDGRLDLAALERMDNAEIMERLTRIRGIGRWTVECFLLFGLGRNDLLPAADIGLRNAVRKVYKLDHQPQEHEVRAIGAGWTPWSSYITYYLWECLKETDL
jgi:DNA-3-methyladenine glycosylase II